MTAFSYWQPARVATHGDRVPSGGRLARRLTRAVAASLALMLMILIGNAAGAEPRPRSYWPTQDWQRIPNDRGVIDRHAYQAFERYAFQPHAPDRAVARRGVRTNGIVVIRNGVLIYERYDRGYHSGLRHLAWSATKSFVHALYGIAIRQGLLTGLDQPVAPFAQALGRAADDWQGMTFQHLMDMSSGFDFIEVYEGSPLSSSVTAMLYGAGRRDMARYVAEHALCGGGPDRRCSRPGQYWSYSSGDSNVLMALLRSVVERGNRDYARFPWTELFDVIGMRSAVWETDAAGTLVGSSYLYAAPRDLAKFGFLYLNDGLWDGRRVLPEGWAASAARPNDAFLITCGRENQRHRLVCPPCNPEVTVRPDACDREPGYGAHWWTNRSDARHGIDSHWPDLPDDLYTAWGHWGQRIYVIPSRDMVIVRTADDRESGVFGDRQFLRHALAAFQPTPVTP